MDLQQGDGIIWMEFDSKVMEDGTNVVQNAFIREWIFSKVMETFRWSIMTAGWNQCCYEYID